MDRIDGWWMEGEIEIDCVTMLAIWIVGCMPSFSAAVARHGHTPAAPPLSACGIAPVLAAYVSMSPVFGGQI